MPRSLHCARRVLVPALLATLLFPVVAAAQLFQLDGGSSNVGTISRAKRSSPATVTLSEEAGSVTMKVAIKLPALAHTYSMSKGFSGRTRIDVASATGLEPVDEEFIADRKPVSKRDELLEADVEVFEGDVVFSRRYRLAKGASAASVKVTGSLRYQICDATSCRPYNENFEVALSSSGPALERQIAPTQKSGGVEKPGPVAWTLRLTPEKPQPGQKATLTIAAKVADGFHIFASDQDPKALGKPTELTVIRLGGLNALVKSESLKADREPELHPAEDKVQRIHHNGVTWTQEFTVSPDATESNYGIGGRVDYQVCTESSCRAVHFEFELGKLAAPAAAPVGAAANSGAPILSASGSGLFDQIQIREPVGSGDSSSDADSLAQAESSKSLGTYLLYAFLGGLILNVMPCVLPVIAIKVLGFVQQAGESRGRVLLLNVAYSAGVIGVFVLLASLAAFFGLKWGGLFQRAEFNIGMTFVVFAMGLSLLGVFEIPIPGFAGSVGAKHREGPLGAFLTGIFATLLATPCSGPFLGVTFTWTLQQTPDVIYLVWTMMGFGMSSPYLLLGLFPQAVKFLPRPGNWMVRFKEFSGFVLLATTIYLLSILKDELLIPVLTALLGVGLGLWMIGHLYNLNSSTAQRWKVRIAALCLAGAISGTGAYLHLNQAKGWLPFSRQAVAVALEEGRPVVVDFTADWCLTCKTMEHTTLNTQPTQALFQKHGFVTLKADWTDGSPEITDILSKLGSESIPVLAVFSPSRPNEPIVLRDAWTQSNLHRQLQAVVDESAESKAVVSEATHSGTAIR